MFHMRNCWHLKFMCVCVFTWFSCQHFLPCSNIISYAKTFTKLFLSPFPLSGEYSFFCCCTHSVKTNLNSGGAVSKLYIANANRNDSGNYTCSLGETAQTTIAVHVLNGMYGLVCNLLLRLQ